MSDEDIELKQWTHERERDHDDDVHLMDTRLRYVPFCWRFKDGPPEASGLAIDAFARATISMSSLFLGPALLEVASEAAGCEADDQDCDARIYGMKPSSVLSNIALGTGLVVAATMPFFGACIDHTSYRKEVGMYTAFILMTIKGVEIMVSKSTWVVVALLQVISGFLYQIHVNATLAYTCELSTDYAVQTRYNTSFTVVFSMASFFFLIVVMATAVSLDLNDIGTARVSQTTTTLVSMALFPAIWLTLFRPRPALSAVPPGQTLASAGFRKIISSARTIMRELPPVWYMMLSIMFSESAANTIITVATTYLKTVLSLDGTQIGLVFFLAIITCIVGTKLGELLSLKYNPIVSTQFSIILFVLTTLSASLLLRGPDQANLSYLFGALWGIPLGGLQVQNQIVIMTIIPRGQEAEMMGNYIFCGQVLSWLPPLVFTMLNELGLPMSVGFSSLNVFFVIGSVFLACVGDYDKARRHAMALGKSAPAPAEDPSSHFNPSLELPSVI